MDNDTEKAFHRAVAEIYKWVDEQIAAAGPQCEISGRCCRFREYGHRLYLTRPEAELLFQKELPHDSPQLDETNRQQISEIVKNACPYQKEGVCTAREVRPLSCRIYFCNPDFQEKAAQITETALKRLKKVHLEFNKPWEYQELSRFFIERV